MKAIAARQKIALPAAVSTQAEVGLGPMTGKPGVFGIAVVMLISVPGLGRASVEALVAVAHPACPFSNVTRGNIEVTLTRA